MSTGFDNVTPSYVNTMTNNKYTTRTSDSSEFDALKDQYSVYLNSNTEFLPERKYTRALALLIAHHYALDDTKDPDAGGSDKYTGSIASENVGDVSQSFGSIPTFKADHAFKQWLSQTRWGTEYIYLMRTFKPTPLVT